MEHASLNYPLHEDFLSNVLITAFDGTYGSSWMWFEPAPLAGQSWLTVKSEDGHTSADNPWMSVRVRLKSGYETGHALFDTREGYVIDHKSLAGAISRILNDDYLNASDAEKATGVRRYVLNAVVEDDAGDIDAEVADCIAQVAAFGKVIFG